MAIPALMRQRSINNDLLPGHVSAGAVASNAGNIAVSVVEGEAGVGLMVEVYCWPERLQAVTAAAISAITAPVKLISMWGGVAIPAQCVVF